MGSHRKLLLPHLFGSVKYDYDLTPPPPPHSSISFSVPLLVVVIGAAMFFSVFFMTIKYLRNRRVRRSLRDPNIHRDPPILFNTQEDFIDEEQGPHLDHPIWYIRTVGLDQSTIDAIAVFKYKKGEGLVDGTDCSVCLSEFQEDEDLRLLPKCSHAFHVDCIDMWLRSHKNCPLCRAPVVRAAAAATAEEPRTANSGPVDTAIEESIENRNVGDEVEEDENSGSGESREMVISLPSSESSEIGDVCDSRDGSRLAGDEREEVQGVRRSVSVDAASASEIYRAVEAAVCSSSVRRQRIKKGKNLRMNLNLNLSSNSNSNSRVIGSCSFRLYRMMKSCSFRSSAHEDFSTTRMSAHPAGRCDVPKNPNSDRAGERSCRSIELSAAEGMEKQ